MNYPPFVLIRSSSVSSDKRMEYLEELLSDKGFVTSLADDAPAFPADVTHYVLPFFLPQDRQTYLFRNLPEGAYTFGATLSPEARTIAGQKQIRHTDILREESFCLENARITAECALGVLITAYPRLLTEVRVALFGYGRIGKALTTLLTHMGVTVKVYDVRSDALLPLRSQGIATSHLWNRSDIDRFSVIVNTVPLYHVLPRDTLIKLSPDSFVLDLASGENNVDWSALRALSADGNHATGLPGRFHPYSAALAILHCIEANLADKKEFV